MTKKFEINPENELNAETEFNGEANSQNAEANSQNAEANSQNAEAISQNTEANSQNVETNLHNAENSQDAENSQNVEVNSQNADVVCTTWQSRKTRLKKHAIAIGKKLLVFLISHVGLTCLVVVYSIVGGFMFMNLEANNELQNRHLVGRMRKQFVKELWEATEKLNVLFMENWTNVADDVFLRFQDSVYDAVNLGWDGIHEKTDAELEWTYPGALLFSVTVITTIGYGHLTPHTIWGRVVTMIYALVGIPLTLLCLSNIGSLMAKSFRLFWERIVCGYCRRRKRKQDSILRRSMQQRGLQENSYVAGNDVICSTEVSLKGTKKKKQEVRVPLVVCLVLVFGYIMLGAMLFSLWEDNWNFFESAYFCFITLSTIGFGDFVPGKSKNAWEDNAKRVSSALYLLFGLALLAMSFELMQGEVRAICRGFAKCIGLCKRKTPQDL